MTTKVLRYRVASDLPPAHNVRLMWCPLHRGFHGIHARWGMTAYSLSWRCRA